MSLTSYQTAPPRDKFLVITLYFKLSTFVELKGDKRIFDYIYNRIIFMYKALPSDYCKGVTPDPIPNSAVKPFSANGTLS
jgi:hypothetical protein